MIRGMSVSLVVALLMGATAVQAQWEPIVRLSETDSASSALSISNPLLTFGSTVLAAWFDCYSGQPSLVCRRSADRGANWASVMQLTTFRPNRAQLALGSSDAVLFVYDSSVDMRFRRSTDNGASWSPSDTLARWSWGGLLAMNTDGYAQFVWEDDDTLCWRRSTNSGAEWSSKAPLRAVGSGNSGLRALASERAPFAYVAFLSNDSLLVSRTTDNGTHWDAAQCIRVASYIPTVLADVDNQGRVHMVWADNHTGNSEVYYVRSTDNGATWSSATRFTISNGSTPCWLDARDANVYVSYSNPTTLKTRRRSFDGGATWEDESTWPSMTPPGQAGYACASLGEGAWLHLAAYSYRFLDTPLSYYIGYYRSKNAGTNWPDSAVVISDADPLYRYPRAITTSGSDVHVLWEDYKYGNYEMVYRRGVGLAGMEERNQDLAPKPALTLSANPSLFSRSTDLSYTLTGDADVSVSIRDIGGRLVWSDPARIQKAGNHVLRWNGEDADGVPVSAGCYFCVLQAGGRTSSSKLLLTR